MIPGLGRTDYAASLWQEGLWATDPRADATSVYRGTALLRINGADGPSIVHAVQRIVERHAILRSRFVVSQTGGLRQVIDPLEAHEIRLIQLDGDASDAACLQQMSRTGESGWTRPFFAEVFEAPGYPVRLGIAAHHAVWDGASGQLFGHELLELLSARLRSRPPSLPVLPVQYGDYSEWHRHWVRSRRTDVDYWNAILDDPPDLIEWPTAVSLDPAAARTAGTIRREYAWRDLAQRARTLKVTPFAVLLSAVGVAVGRYCYRDDLIIGVPVTTRTEPELRRLLGFFVNVLPIRMRVRSRRSVDSLVGDVQAQILGGLVRAQTPLQYLTLEQSSRPLPPITVVCQLSASSSMREVRDDVALELVPMTGETGRYDLTLGFDLAAGSFGLTVEYRRAVLDAAGAGTFLEHLDRVVHGFVGGRVQRIGDVGVPITTPSPARPHRSGGRPALAHRVHEALVRTGDRVVVRAGNDSATGAQLLQQVQQVAAVLSARGLTPEDVVAIPAERSLAFVVAVLGTVFAGGVYWPVAVSIPRDRLEQMARDAAPTFILCPNAAHPLAELGIRSTSVRACLECAAAPWSPPDIHPDGGFCLLFTSGSTGQPKGVLNTQAAMLNRIEWMQRHYGLTCEDVVLHKTPATFDVAGWEIFWPLIAGAQLVVANSEGHRDMAYLADLIFREKVTTVHFVPSVLAAFLKEPASARVRLSRVICSGEVLTPHLQSECAKSTGARVSNLYGPTEAAIDVTAWDHAMAPGARRTPIGHAIDNVIVRIVDADLQPVAPGASGQLVIGGVAPARGYVGSPAATASRFVPDPLAFEPGDRMYLTGDLATQRPDGAIEFIRRIDSQLKVGGVRLELEDVEDAIRQVAGVGDAAVAVHVHGEIARPLLTAFVLQTGLANVSAEQVRSAARHRFASAIVSDVVFVSEFPRTASGKLDRAALNRQVPERVRSHTPCETDMEIRVASVWQRVLGVDVVGALDNLFELGGDSVSSMRIVAALEQSGFRASVENLFDSPVLRDFARRVASIDAAGGPAPPWPTREPGRNVFPTSAAQRRLWLLEQLHPGTPMYNVAGAVRLTGRVDETAFERAFRYVIGRHDAFRTCFRSDRGVPVQVLSRQLEVPLERRDLSTEPADGRTAALSNLRTDFAERPFDLDAAPLLRACLVRLDADVHVFAIAMHHILCDAWSLSNMVKELAESYSAYVEGREPLLRTCLQYPEYAVWHREWTQSPAVARQIDDWVHVLGDARPCVLAGDARPARRSYSAAVAKLALPPHVIQIVDGLTRTTGTTPFMVLLAALATTLRQYGAEHELIVATGVAHRRRVEFETMVGFFVNFLPLRIPLGRSPTLETLLPVVRRVALRAFANQDAPFEEIVRRVALKRRSDAIAFGDIAFVHQNVPRWSRQFPGLAWETIEDLDRRWTPHDLHMSVEGDARSLVCYLAYATDRFKAETIDRFLGTFGGILESGAVAGGIAR